MFIAALNAMLTLFLCMLVGYSAAKIKVLTKESLPIFNKLLLNITFPAMILSSLNIEFTKDIMYIAPTIFIVSIAYNLLLWIMAIILCNILRVKSNRSILIFGFIFTNVAFIGFPLIEAVYGKESLIYLSLFNIIFNILVFSLGTYLLEENSKHKISVKKILTTPAMVATWIGLFLLISQLVVPGVFISDLGTTRLPYFVSNAIQIIGNATSPLAMIIVGISLVQTDIKKVFCDVKLHIFSFFKLLVAPIIIFIILNPFISNEMLLSITVILSGLPTATLSVILAEEFELDYVYSSEIIFITTLYSIITVPFLCFVFS